MRKFLFTALLACAALFPPGPVAQADESKVVFMPIPDSLKDTEVHIAKLLLDRLKVNSSLQMRKDNSEDLVLRAHFNPDADKKLPKIAVLIDTRITGRDEDGKPSGQIVSIASFADVKLKPDMEEAQLAWANKWNSQTIPMHVYISGDKVVAVRNLFNSATTPLSENAIIHTFTGVVRSWTTLIPDLQQNEMIEP